MSFFLFFFPFKKDLPILASLSLQTHSTAFLLTCTVMLGTLFGTCSLINKHNNKKTIGDLNEKKSSKSLVLYLNQKSPKMVHFIGLSIQRAKECNCICWLDSSTSTLIHLISWFYFQFKQKCRIQGQIRASPSHKWRSQYARAR